MGADSSPGARENPWRVATAQVLVEQLDDPRPDPATAHHLSRVLRLGPDELVCATDGRGGWRMCNTRSDGSLAPLGEVHRTSEPTPVLTVGFAPLKGSRNELVVQKLTEVGVDRIRLLRCERSVVRWNAERSRRNLGRLRRIAAEASSQCRRLWLPTIEETDLVDAVEGDAGSAGSPVLADAGGPGLTFDTTTVLVGPEGGWSDTERRLAPAVGLGANVLRAETAAVVAGSTMAQLRLGLQGPGLASLSP